MIGVFSACAILVICMLTTVVALASGTHNVRSDIAIEYKAQKIQGSASATYTISGTTKSMTTDGTSSGATSISFKAEDDKKTQTLKPQDSTFTLTTDSTEILFTYTFNNEGSMYYATLTNGLSSTAGLTFTYSTDGTTYNSTVFNKAQIAGASGSTVGTTTLYVKVTLSSQDNDISCSGSLTWTLSAQGLD